MPDFDCQASRVLQGQSAIVPGTFSFDGKQLRWSPDDSSSTQPFTAALQAVNGAVQRAKSKPQMRIPTLSGPLMLEFPSEEAREAAINKLTPLLNRKSKAVEPTGPLADVKKQLLHESGELKGLYNELVKAGIITDAEFWKTRQDVVLKRAGGKQQTVGLSSALLAQLQPTPDGKKQLTMTITPQFIHQVFAEKPHVHRAYVENVPQKMNDKEFWTRFTKHEIQFQVRRRSGKRSYEPPDSLFSQLIPNEAPKLDSERIDPTVNLAVDNFDHARSTAGIDDAYLEGLGEGIARDMNRHSAVVLQGPDAHQDSAAASSSMASQTQPVQPLPQPDSWRDRGGSRLDDLRTHEEVPADELHIRNPRRYFERAAQDASEAGGRQHVSRERIAAGLRDSDVRLSVDPVAAEQVLQDLHRESALALPDTYGSTRTYDALVPQMQTMLRQAAMLCNELLRHFWECLPLRASATREKRATKLKEVLDQKYTQLDHMQGAAQPEDRLLIAQLLRPVKASLDAALEAYQNEMQSVKR